MGGCPSPASLPRPLSPCHLLFRENLALGALETLGAHLLPTRSNWRSPHPLPCRPPSPCPPPCPRPPPQPASRLETHNQTRGEREECADTRVLLMDTFQNCPL